MGLGRDGSNVCPPGCQDFFPTSQILSSPIAQLSHHSPFLLLWSTSEHTVSVSAGSLGSKKWGSLNLADQAFSHPPVSSPIFLCGQSISWASTKPDSSRTHLPKPCAFILSGIFLWLFPTCGMNLTYGHSMNILLVLKQPAYVKGTHRI